MRTSLLVCICVATTIAGCATQSVSRASLEQNNATERCRANLRQIQSVKTQWSTAEKKSGDDTMTREDIMRVDRYLLNAFECPEGGTYTWGHVAEPAACSVAGHGLE